MNEIWQIFLGSMMVAFSGALVPGPMLTLVVTSVAQRGFWTSFFIVVGHSILELAVVVSFYLGVLKYLNNPIVLKVISVFGGAFLIYMGANILVSIFRKKINPAVKAIVGIGARSSLGVFRHSEKIIQFIKA